MACYKPWQHHIYWATRLQIFHIVLVIWGFLIIYTIPTNEFVCLPVFWNFILTQCSSFTVLWSSSLSLLISNNLLFCSVFSCFCYTILFDKTQLRIQEITDHGFIYGSNTFSAEIQVSLHSVSIQKWTVKSFFL